MRTFPIAAMSFLLLAILPGCASAERSASSPASSENRAGTEQQRATSGGLRIRPFGNELNEPVWVGAPKGAQHVFAVERAGRVMVRPRAGAGSWKVFLDIRSRVNADGGEQGLLSVAFSPRYSTDGRFYVYYTNASGDGVIARYARSSTTKASRSERRMLIVPLGGGQGDNHNGGQLQFGPDGMLYIGTGDGGGGGDPDGNSQDLGTMLGKMLRVDVSRSGATIPTGNPFTSRAGAEDEIFYLGLRNPWRFSFDRSTGALYIADVGQGDHEEINIVAPRVDRSGGLNFGWNRFEGPARFSDTPLASGTRHTPPTYSYTHADGACSITGGYVYRGSRATSLRGVYLYADFCQQRLFGVKKRSGRYRRVVNSSVSFTGVTSFGEDGSGELLAAAGSQIYRLT